MLLTRARSLDAIAACAAITVTISIAIPSAPAAAQPWEGLREASAELSTERYDFEGAGGSNENYYDGDFGDLDGDGWVDRALISRYGLLWNSGDGIMIPVSSQRSPTVPPSSTPSLTGYLFGDEVSIGNDAVQWADIDGDGDLDVMQGGNGEPFVVQSNRGGRFAVTQRLSGSALDILNIDIERDGDVDLLVACWFPSGPQDLSLFVNDGTGRFTSDGVARGLPYAADRITGAATGDVDRDGDFDILLASQLAEEMWVMTNDGTGRFTRAQRLDFTGTFRRGGFGQGMSLGDIDDDGDLDLAIAHEDYTGAHPRVAHGLYVNDGTGRFVEESATRFSIGSASFIGRLVGDNGKLADLDYDGDLDFYVFTEAAGPPLNFQLFLNDGTGVFTYTEGLVGAVTSTSAASDGTGADADLSDLDRDGSYDVWVGVAGGEVTPLLNTHRDPTGLPADVPRDLGVVDASAGGISIAWSPPPFAATARHYVVYRSLAGGREERDRVRLHTVAISRFEDEGFAAPITRFTRTDELNDPDVTLDAGRVTFIDRSAVPGVAYFYSVAHVGPENIRSVPTAEVSAMIPPADGVDATEPELDIVSPGAEWWSAHPRIVVTFADGGSGVDPSSLSVTLSQAAGSIAAGTNLRSMGEAGAGSWVLSLGPDQAMALGLVDLVASVSDAAGNRVERTARFAVTLASPMPPTASASADVVSGVTPLDVRFTGTGSDPDGEIMRWEWTFGDGATGWGRTPSHRYLEAGTYAVRLIATDNEGGVAEATLSIAAVPCTSDCPADAGVAPGTDGGPGADGGVEATTDGGTSSGFDAGRVPIRASDPGGCGCRANGRSDGGLVGIVALGWLLARRARRRVRR
jgi:hypothetical protein